MPPRSASRMISYLPASRYPVVRSIEVEAQGPERYRQLPARNVVVEA